MMIADMAWYDYGNKKNKNRKEVSFDNEDDLRDFIKNMNANAKH